MDIVITGLREVQQRLEQLAPNMARKAMKQALTAGGRVIADEVQLRAPKLTGELAANVAMKGKVSDKGGFVVIGVTYRGKRALKSRRPGKVPSTQDPGVYAKFVELGTKNMAARPFLRPAIDSKAEESVKVFAQVLDDFIKTQEHK